MCRDLNHSNQYIVGLALCALGNICSAEMARDLAPEVERLLQFRDPNTRKKVSLFFLNFGPFMFWRICFYGKREGRSSHYMAVLKHGN